VGLSESNDGEVDGMDIDGTWLGNKVDNLAVG